MIEIDKRQSPLTIQHTRVVQPDVHSNRAEAQAAWHVVHTIHILQSGERVFIALAELHPHTLGIIKIFISRSHVRRMRDELYRMGISHSTVYGDYQAVCRSIAPGFGLV